MRILHTSDWHLGRSFHGVQLLDAQVEVLRALVDIVRSESVDVVAIAGDIYDRAVPSGEAVAALSHLLGQIRSAGATVIGMSGNHDSASRLSFAEPLLATAGVALRGNPALVDQPVIVGEKDGSSAVAFYPIPFLEPEVARHQLGEPEARSHDRLLRIATDRARNDLSARPDVKSVALVHAFVTGGETSDSEAPLAVGGSAEVGLDVTSGFDYVALGHLHGRQSLGSGRARYSGSPMPYSFSERSHTKGVWLIDLPQAGAMSVKAVDLPVHRTLHQLRGSFEDLLNSREHTAAEDSFVHAVITDSVLPPDAMARLRQRFEHALLLTHDAPASISQDGNYAAKVKGRSDIQLACDFIEHVCGEAPDEEELLAIQAAMSTRDTSKQSAA